MPDSAQDDRRTELERLVDEATPDEALSWGSDLYDEAPEDLDGQRWDTVRLWAALDGAPIVQDAIGVLGEGDVTVGTSRLWALLGDPARAVAMPTEKLLSKLAEAAGKGGAK